VLSSAIEPHLDGVPAVLSQAAAAAAADPSATDLPGDQINTGEHLVTGCYTASGLFNFQKKKSPCSSSMKSTVLPQQ